MRAINPGGVVSVVTAAEAALIAKAGIASFCAQMPLGSQFVLAGQPFVITGEATREEFLAAMEASGQWSVPPGRKDFRLMSHEEHMRYLCAPALHYYRVSTD